MLRAVGKRVLWACQKLRTTGRPVSNRKITTAANTLTRPKTAKLGARGTRFMSGFFSNAGRKVMGTLIGAGLAGAAQMGVDRADRVVWGDACTCVPREDGALLIVGQIAGFDQMDLKVTVDAN